MVTGSDIAGRLVGTGTQLYTLRYGRAQEYEADSLGIRYMTAAGYDPYAAADILASLDTSSNLTTQAAGSRTRALPTWMSTHPNSEDRIHRAVRLAEATGRPEAEQAEDTKFLSMLDGRRTAMQPRRE